MGTWGECEKVMQEILFTEICGVITVRNEVVQAGFGIPKDEVVDCSFTDWIFHECSVSCDDDLVGGKQLLTREVITPKTENGHACPAMNMTKKCNQILCPVDCNCRSMRTIPSAPRSVAVVSSRIRAASRSSLRM